MNSYDLLCEICHKRLDWLVSSTKLYASKDFYLARLGVELPVFEKSGYSDLILIIREYITWAKSNDVVVGPGRGSAAGSLVVYLSEITTIDPIRFNLIFERFLNPERVSMPDIDSDFSDRDAVIKHLQEKYGMNRVAKVGVPSLFKPRSAIDEFARVIGVDYHTTKEITKLIGDSKTFDEAFKSQPRLSAYEDGNPKLFRLAREAQGLVRQITTHPSAVILTSNPIGVEIPMQRPPGSEYEDGELVTGWDGEELDRLGYAKLDILTVDNLSVINRTVKMLPEEERKKIDIYDLPLNDESTLAGFELGETVAVFQFEEPKTISILTQLSNIRFDDITAVNALIRPGLDVQDFINNRNNPEGIEYLLPELRPILESTYGVILYQEQVMRICVDIAGFSMAKADRVRKIIAKTANQKSDKGLAEVFNDFEAGYKSKNFDPSKFEPLWNKILACQNYVFNKSHAVAYGYIAYADMYLKRHYPVEFMCAALQTKSREIYVKECSRLGINVLPPDVMLSEESYSIEGNSIRVGLACIKHIGSKAKSIISRRPYIDDFHAINNCKLSKTHVSSLIKAGAFDRFGNRNELMDKYCDDIEGAATIATLASGEKDVLGFYLTANPLGDFVSQLSGTVTPLSDNQPKNCNVGGMILRIKEHVAKTGPMAFVDLLTDDGEMNVIVWPSTYAIEKKRLSVGNIIISKGSKTDKGNYAIRDIVVLKSV